MIKFCDIPNYSINFLIILILSFIIYSFVKVSNKEFILKSLSEEQIKKIYINKKRNFKKFKIIFGIISFIILIINPFEKC